MHDTLDQLIFALVCLLDLVTLGIGGFLIRELYRVLISAPEQETLPDTYQQNEQQLTLP